VVVKKKITTVHIISEAGLSVEQALVTSRPAKKQNLKKIRLLKSYFVFVLNFETCLPWEDSCLVFLKISLSLPGPVKPLRVLHQNW
jgi:hypothetical protein